MPSAASLSQMGAVLLHCQTMALYTGLPVFLSQTIVVSRWFVMPMPAISVGESSLFSKASARARSCVSSITIGSCSTQPGLGYICGKGYCAIVTGTPFASNIMALELVVPWSSATT